MPFPPTRQHPEWPNLPRKVAANPPKVALTDGQLSFLYPARTRGRLPTAFVTRTIASSGIPGAPAAAPKTRTSRQTRPHTNASRGPAPQNMDDVASLHTPEHVTPLLPRIPRSRNQSQKIPLVIRAISAITPLLAQALLEYAPTADDLAGAGRSSWTARRSRAGHGLRNRICTRVLGKAQGHRDEVLVACTLEGRLSCIPTRYPGDATTTTALYGSRLTIMCL